jgi:hypothetical protein
MLEVNPEKLTTAKIITTSDGHNRRLPICLLPPIETILQLVRQPEIVTPLS